MLEAAVAAVQAGEVVCHSIVQTAQGPALCGRPAIAVWNVTLASNEETPEGNVISASAPQPKTITTATPVCERCDVTPATFAIGVQRVPLPKLVGVAGARLAGGK